MPATERMARLFAGKARYKGAHRGRSDDQGQHLIQGNHSAPLFEKGKRTVTTHELRRLGVIGL